MRQLGILELKDQSANPTVAMSQTRLPALDIARGLIMVLMAFCHVKDYVGITDYEVLDWDAIASWPQQSPITYFIEQLNLIIVAGGFFMLMGMGIVFFMQTRLRKGWSLQEVNNYLILRGFILIALQLTLLQAFEMATQQKLFFYAGVLMTLGITMIVTTLLYSFSIFLQSQIRLPFTYLIPATLILLICIGLQLKINTLHNTTPSLWENLFIVGGEFNYGIFFDINFTPLAWLPAVLFGLLLGEVLYRKKAAAFHYFGWLAISMLFAFAVLRYANFQHWFSFGDYLTIPDHQTIHWQDYFCISKYPPSICYYLFSLGINLGIIYLCQQLLLNVNALQPLLTRIAMIGQCALFFFVVHWFVYYPLATLLHGDTLSSDAIWGVWLLGLVILYPLCLRYASFKARQPADSLWRLF